MSDLNDPRVLFAAERTLLAWARTALTLMAFGFAVERFSLFVQVLRPNAMQGGHTGSFLIGIALLLLGTAAAWLSVIQYRSVVATLKPSEVPDGYWVSLSVALNVLLGLLGCILILMLFHQQA